MKKSILALFCGTVILLNAPIVLAESRTARGVSETDQLGITAGVALACQADAEQLKNYEMIASRILVNPTTSEKAEKEILTAYGRAKLKAYEAQKKTPELSCREVLTRFYNQPIFKSVVYRDGAIKLPDGKIIKPQRKIVKAGTNMPAKKPMTVPQKGK